MRDKNLVTTSTPDSQKDSLKEIKTTTNPSGNKWKFHGISILNYNSAII